MQISPVLEGFNPFFQIFWSLLLENWNLFPKYKKYFSPILFPITILSTLFSANPSHLPLRWTQLLNVSTSDRLESEFFISFVIVKSPALSRIYGRIFGILKAMPFLVSLSSHHLHLSPFFSNRQFYNSLLPRYLLFFPNIILFLCLVPSQHYLIIQTVIKLDFYYFVPQQHSNPIMVDAD